MLTANMKENLDAICFDCDQNELDLRSVNALIKRGLVERKNNKYVETNEGDFISRYGRIK